MTHSQSTCSGTVGHHVQKGVGRAWLYLYITLSSLNVFYNHCSLKRGLNLAPLLRLVADRTCARWVRRDLCLHWRAQTLPRLPCLRPAHLLGQHSVWSCLRCASLPTQRQNASFVPLGPATPGTSPGPLAAPFCTSVFVCHSLLEHRLSWAVTLLYSPSYPRAMCIFSEWKPAITCNNRHSVRRKHSRSRGDGAVSPA